MKQKLQILGGLFALVLSSCSAGPQENPAYQLTAAEEKLCDSLQIDKAIIRNIRSYNSNPVEPFHYSLSKIIENGVVRDADPLHLRGLVFTEENKKSYDVVLGLQDGLREQGYTIFLLGTDVGLDKNSAYIGVLKTPDKYAVLKQIGTDGTNHGIANDSLIAIIKQFDTKYSLSLIGASGDWCEFAIQNEPADWMEFAKEVYAVCPDVVDQGTGTVEALALEMKKTKRLYFWWD